MRKNVLVTLSVLAAVALAATGSTAWAQKGPIKMGMVVSLSGDYPPCKHCQ